MPSLNSHLNPPDANWKTRVWILLKNHPRILWNCLQPWNDPQNEDGRIFTKCMRQAILVRGTVLTFLLAVAFAFLALHVSGVQLQQHDYYLRQARFLCQRSTEETAHRGSILDLNGNKYAVDTATQDVYAEPKRFQDSLDEATEIIARELEMDKETLLRRFRESAAHQFQMKISDGVPQSFVREKKLTRIKGIVLKPLKDASRNVTSFKVYFNPSSLSAAEEKASLKEISECFQISLVELREKSKLARERCQEILVKRGVSREAATAMLQELHDRKITSGVRFLDSWVRKYPRNCELANLLGFLDFDRKGASGLEQLMDQYLQPTFGKSTFLHDLKGRPVDEGKTIITKPVNGADVYLTIQEPIQRILEEELSTLWTEFKPDRAYAIMIEPSTGAVMGLAQYPQFNPNDRVTMEDPDLCQNHILLQSYDPGSIMKPVSLTGVLAYGVATLDTVKDCEKGRWVYGRKLLRDSHPFEELTLSQVIQKSSNIGTAKFAIDLGEERMYKHLYGFGFGRTTGLGFYPEGKKPVVFRQEATGLFRELHRWDSLTISRVPMGQGITVPLLQMLQAWSALANPGTIMQPYLVDHVQYADGTVEYSVPKVKYDAVAPADAVEKMTQALISVTEGGTGTRAAIPGFKVAAKTGTAQIWLPGDKKLGVKPHYAEHQFLASFIGFVPAESPRFLLLVSAENPTSGPSHTGAGVAAPVFKRIAVRTLEYLQVAPAEESAPAPQRINATAGLAR